MNTKDLIKMVDEGLKPVVIFKNMEISDFDPDDGMMGKVISYNIEFEGSVKFDIDMTEFITNNKNYAKRDWYDKGGNATLTWFETTHYPKNNITDVWEMLDDELMFLSPKENTHLYNEFAKQNKFSTYVDFLEDKVLSSRIK